MKTPALDGDGDPELARAHWLAALFPDDRMFAQIKALAQASLNEQASIATANKPSLAADRDAHLVWATKRWIEQHVPAPVTTAGSDHASKPKTSTLLARPRLLELADKAGLGPGEVSGVIQARLELFGQLVASEVQADCTEAAADQTSNAPSDEAPVDLIALEAAAISAGGGEWTAQDGIVWFADGDSALIADPANVAPPVFLACENLGQWPEPIAREDVAAFAALACPANVLALIKRLRATECAPVINLPAPAAVNGG